ncbi:uroporphyrinogen III synthase [Rhodococcus sp. WMMA185]|uniref:uroporphyrinogen-III synthase n=1 Tax=Rhodococcus sp. WMMA185 TaxID=679318 RepID=UPI0008785B2F|nr:uroporphyrinogen-III synthase [Rhodococcus sp. WMMA185]AOW91959.1 uroporphyrinogen III synthase [Rhodococcus sp. WMMA185]
MSNDELSGLTIAVTAERRAAEFITLLERHGARVTHTPAIHVLPLVDDSELRSRTSAVIASPPDLLVVSTAVGFRGWLDAARAWGQEDALLAALRSVRIITRGPKAKGAVRGVGLREEWSPETESSEGVYEHLVAEGVDGLRVAVQLHGTITEWEPTIDLSVSLADAGAETTALSVYRWIRPHDQGPMRALVDHVIAGGTDAVTFTSAPAVSSLLCTAKDADLVAPLLDAFRGPVAPVCVGPVTAAPLTVLGVDTMQPGRSRLGSMAKYIIEELSKRR